MDSITNKAFLIGVGIFVTVAITSGIMLTISNMRDVYKDVYETDISLSRQFSDFDKYDGTQLSGGEVVNTINKYYNDPKADVYIGEILKNTKIDLSSNEFNQIAGHDYSSRVTINNDKAEIVFTKE